MVFCNLVEEMEENGYAKSQSLFNRWFSAIKGETIGAVQLIESQSLF